MALRIASQAEPIPGYKLIERLGGGGFGEVWKAMAPGGLLKAIKFVYGDLTSSDEEGQRAEQELKALSRVKTVRHPYILSLERYDILEGRLVIVMELADRNLYDRLKDCRASGLPGVPREELLRYMEETAEALDMMNVEYQLQHLDIKPQNLFLIHNHVKVADFGLVKDLAGMMASLTGGVTPVYAAPETFDGWVSRFCDQYSLAIVFQELLTGTRPFVSSSVAQLIQQHLKSAPNLTALPPGDREAIGRSLAKNPDERFPTCMDMVRALRSSGVEVSRAAKSLRSPSPQAGPMLPPLIPQEARSAEETGRDQSTPAIGEDDRSERPPVIPSGQTQWIPAPGEDRPSDHRLNRPPARQEVEGNGVLMPALIIGLGGLGLGVLKRYLECMHERFDRPMMPECLRLLYIDTDPETALHASAGEPASLVGPGDFLLARLNRPSHYLRNKHRMGGWFNPKMLYRIPRSFLTTGLRVLGRLAFMDNYKMIHRRLQAELALCHEREPLQHAAEKTGLGLRTTRPRVYVVCGLAGGSGSGMFLDLAYVIRRIMRQHGHENPEIIGIFLIPAVDRHPARTLGMGNAFAALTELNHFSAPGTTFSAQYDEKERPLNDQDPPFARCLFLQLPEDGESRSVGEVAGLAGDYLFRNLVTPLGRVADEARDRISILPRQPWCLAYQTFGSFRVSLPRQALMTQAARLLCVKLVERWLAKDATPYHDEVASLVSEEWAMRGLGAEKLIEALQEACAKVLGDNPEMIFAKLTEPLNSLDIARPEEAKQTLTGVLNCIDEILGKPEEFVGSAPGTLAEPMQQSAETRVSHWSARLAAFAVSLVEQPEYRLAGAEAAFRDLVNTIDNVCSEQEPLIKEFGSRSQDARERIAKLMENLSNPAAARRNASLLPNLIELVRAYPRWRLQCLILQRVSAAYVSLRGALSDQHREVNYCRERLHAIKRRLDEAPNEHVSLSGTMLTRALLPEGCRTLAESVEALRRRFTTEDINELDKRVQNVISKDFSSLVEVCLGSANRLKELERSMMRLAMECVGTRIGNAEVAEIYLAQYDTDDQVRDDLASMFAEAAPHLNPSRQPGSEIAILAAPPGRAGGKVRRLAQQAVPDSDLGEAESTDDIVFYRERFQMLLSELEQLGPLGYEAYRQVGMVESFTPHSRTDVPQWRAAATN
jgi:eukaryotic-like serine/threonine-protein kinase